MFFMKKLVAIITMLALVMVVFSSAGFPSVKKKMEVKLFKFCVKPNTINGTVLFNKSGIITLRIVCPLVAPSTAAAS